MNKVNLFYPMDKGFFGKTLNSPIKSVTKQSSDLKLDSIDDLNKHFQMQMFKSKFAKTPKFDSFASAISEQKSNDFFTKFSQFFGV